MGQSAFGTIFRIEKGTDLVGVGELTDIGGPSISVDDVEVTSHQSTDAHREYEAGLVDAGEMSIEGNLTSGNANQLKDIADARAKVDLDVEYPPYLDGANWKCMYFDLNGILTAWEPSAPYEDKLSFSGSVKISGKPTLTEEDIFLITFDVTDSVSTDDVQGAKVTLYSDSARSYQHGKALTTDADGEAVFYLRAGTYYYTVSKDGYTDNEDSITVTVDATESVSFVAE